MDRHFGTLPTGEPATLYTISLGPVCAKVTDLGATLVSLSLPCKENVVLGWDNAGDYLSRWGCVGATVGRCANRIGGACFVLNGTTWTLNANDGGNSLHSGPDGWHKRLWKVVDRSDSNITFQLESPHGDQGFPGNLTARVTYSLEAPATLVIRYWAISDRDTIFNPTNHRYFNLGKDALKQTLMMPARTYTPFGKNRLPTGEVVTVAGTPMDFRTPKTIGQDLNLFFRGYDHNFEVFCDPCAVLRDPESGLTMAVTTDRPGLQLFTTRWGVCLETQFWPDAIHHTEWTQPVIQAGVPHESRTTFAFSW